jgi:hypothetical protein
VDICPVNVNTTDATTGATALLLPAQNTYTRVSSCVFYQCLLPFVSADNRTVTSLQVDFRRRARVMKAQGSPQRPSKSITT